MSEVHLPECLTNDDADDADEYPWVCICDRLLAYGQRVGVAEFRRGQEAGMAWYKDIGLRHDKRKYAEALEAAAQVLLAAINALREESHA